MIYSKLLQTNIAVQIESKRFTPKDYGMFTRYQVKDNKIPVGYVDLQDTKDGCYVMYIKNQNPELYSGFGHIADQIEVEHCLKRQILHPHIESEAAMGTLIQHYKRGKRYIDETINKYLEGIVKHLQKGEQIYTGQFGAQKMFMPQDMVQRIIENIKKHPLLK